MKVETNFENKKFDPIELKITIESEEELYELWHRFNASIMALRSDNIKIYPLENANLTGPVWYKINDIVKELNLKK